jgi:hypothetical protein
MSHFHLLYNLLQYSQTICLLFYKTLKYAKITREEWNPASLMETVIQGLYPLKTWSLECSQMGLTLYSSHEVTHQWYSRTW